MPLSKVRFLSAAGVLAVAGCAAALASASSSAAARSAHATRPSETITFYENPTTPQGPAQKFTFPISGYELYAGSPLLAAPTSLGAGRKPAGIFTVRLHPDASSAGLFHLDTSATRFARVELLVHSATQPSLGIMFDAHLVSVRAITWSGTGANPTETVTFDFLGPMQMSYQQSTTAATATVSWTP